ncbi:MAG: substrate-binding domain-containing protein [Clostridia bacterium]|nr:substrate-binding domain-containing protein [Clostridia bacterium]
MKTRRMTIHNTIRVLPVAILILAAFYIGIILIEPKELKDSVVQVQDVGSPQYHFAVIAQNTDDSFWQSIRSGAFEAAKEFNVAVEFNGPRFTNIAEELQYLDIAIASRVDGIITHVLDEEQFQPLIDKAEKLNIPVVTIENDAKNSKRVSYVGTSGFRLGVEGGRLVVKSRTNSARIAVILNSYENDGENVMQNLRIAGLKDVIKSYPDIKIRTVQTCKPGIFSAEEITKNILNNFPDVDTILCTNSKDTLGVAQVIVDLNKLGDIVIIGYGNTPEILRYVENKVIYGTVASNPEKMGYESIKALYEVKKNNRTSSYIDTGVNAITAQNVGEYTESEKEKKEQGLKK